MHNSKKSSPFLKKVRKFFSCAGKKFFSMRYVKKRSVQNKFLTLQERFSFAIFLSVLSVFAEIYHQIFFQFPQIPTPFQKIRTILFNLLPKPFRMVHLTEVTQLVDQDIFHNILRQQQEHGIERNGAAFCRAASPASLLDPDRTISG